MEYLKDVPCFWLLSWKDFICCCFLMKWCTTITQPEVKRANKLLLSNSGLKISQFRTLKSLPLWNSRPIHLETLWGQLLIKYIPPLFFFSWLMKYPTRGHFLEIWPEPALNWKDKMTVLIFFFWATFYLTLKMCKAIPLKISKAFFMCRLKSVNLLNLIVS